MLHKNTLIPMLHKNTLIPKLHKNTLKPKLHKNSLWKVGLILQQLMELTKKFHCAGKK